VEIGEQKKAEMLLDVLEQIAPEHLTVKQIARVVRGGSLLNMMKKLAERKPTARSRTKKNTSFKA
jgi:hypothetical protein